MRHYYSAQQIRDAEAPLLAALPDGALMRRAAWPLSVAIAAELRRRTGGVAGRRVCAVVGSGDNGGDALWAAGERAAAQQQWRLALTAEADASTRWSADQLRELARRRLRAAD